MSQIRTVPISSNNATITKGFAARSTNAEDKPIIPSKQLLLNVAVSVAGSFHNRTFGLLGTYDGNKHNDLRNKYGNII
ncbi:unnamed protein product [Rotaria sp. Silwood1]|nr:unnamed protein product [Rotaria sp. Silwood1]